MDLQELDYLLMEKRAMTGPKNAVLLRPLLLNRSELSQNRSDAPFLLLDFDLWVPDVDLFASDLLGRVIASNFFFSVSLQILIVNQLFIWHECGFVASRCSDLLY